MTTSGEAESLRFCLIRFKNNANLEKPREELQRETETCIFFNNFFLRLRCGQFCVNISHNSSVNLDSEIWIKKAKDNGIWSRKSVESLRDLQSAFCYYFCYLFPQQKSGKRIKNEIRDLFWLISDLFWLISVNDNLDIIDGSLSSFMICERFGELNQFAREFCKCFSNLLIEAIAYFMTNPVIN